MRNIFKKNKNGNYGVEGANLKTKNGDPLLNNSSSNITINFDPNYENINQKIVENFENETKKLKEKNKKLKEKNKELKEKLADLTKLADIQIPSNIDIEEYEAIGFVYRNFKKYDSFKKFEFTLGLHDSLLWAFTFNPNFDDFEEASTKAQFFLNNYKAGGIFSTDLIERYSDDYNYLISYSDNGIEVNSDDLKNFEKELYRIRIDEEEKNES